MTILLFDIDGTLLLTSGAGSRALEKAFLASFDLAGAMDGVPVAGRTDRAILLDVFQRRLGRCPIEEEIEALTERYASMLEQSLAGGTRSVEIMPGVPSLLNALARRDDLTLALGTGNLERTGRMKLRAAGLDHYFSTGGFAEDAGPAGERHLLLEAGARKAAAAAGISAAREAWRVLVIGDTVRDITAARRVGYSVLAVATGGDSMASLQEAGADAVFDDLSRTDEAVRAIDALTRPSPPRPSIPRTGGPIR